jgi:CDGSH-type Zn-finger protein
MTKGDDISIQIGTTQADPELSITILPDGPMIVSGEVPLRLQSIEANSEGLSVAYGDGKAFPVKKGTALCRCGSSRKKPYCDGSHRTAPVDLTETASFEPLLEGSTEISGPERILTDNEKYCAFARFCDNGQRIWNEVQMEGRDHAHLAEEMAHFCPSGRLIVWDRETRQPVENAVPATLSLIEDPGTGSSGPLVLRGGIRVESASGTSYEVRNRQALCRCGHSSNKPFCDGTHASIRFRDEL